MHQRFLFALILFIFCSTAHAQDDNVYDDNTVTVQFGVSGGAMNCITDLGGKSAIIKTMKPAGGFYAGAFYGQVIGARLEITWGSVTANDANGRDAGVRVRNLNFASDISEISLLAEFHPLRLLSSFHFPVSPYLLGGIGSFSFNPYTKINGVDVFLQPLHTEGEGFPETGRPNYKLTQFMVPVGGGLSYPISSLLNVKGELIYRFLNTDYLDDVSTTYIDPTLFDKNLTPVAAAMAKKLYFRSGEVNSNAVAPTAGSARGSSAKDGYYSVNIKLELNLGR